MPNHMTLMCFDADLNLFQNLELFLKFTFSLVSKKTINFSYIGTAAKDRWIEGFFFTNFTYIKFYPYIYTSKLCLTSRQTREQIEDYLRRQDVIFVGGGDPIVMLKIWQETGFLEILNKLKNEDKLPLLTGFSAGAMYLFNAGISDSIPEYYTPVKCMGWFQESCTPHANSKTTRKCDFDSHNKHDRITAYQKAIAKNIMPSGYALPDNCMLHFYNQNLLAAYTTQENEVCSYVSEKKIIPLETKLLTYENTRRHAHNALQFLAYEDEYIKKAS